MKKNNTKISTEREIRKIDKRANIALSKLLKTLGCGISIGLTIYVIGFIIGTVVYSKETTLHIKIDEISIKITHFVYLVTALISTPFAIRLFKFKNQKDILKSIQ